MFACTEWSCLGSGKTEALLQLLKVCKARLEECCSLVTGLLCLLAGVTTAVRCPPADSGPLQVAQSSQPLQLTSLSKSE